MSKFFSTHNLLRDLHRGAGGERTQEAKSCTPTFAAPFRLFGKGVGTRGGCSPQNSLKRGLYRLGGWHPTLGMEDWDGGRREGMLENAERRGLQRGKKGTQGRLPEPRSAPPPSPRLAPHPCTTASSQHEALRPLCCPCRVDLRAAGNRVAFP